MIQAAQGAESKTALHLNDANENEKRDRWIQTALGGCTIFDA